MILCVPADHARYDSLCACRSRTLLFAVYLQITHPEGLWPVLAAYVGPHTYEPVMLLQMGATAGAPRSAWSQPLHMHC